VIIQQTDTRLRELESRVAAISAQAEAVDADRIVGLARQTGEVTAEAAVVCHELRDLLARVEAVQSACEANARRLESLRDQTDVARRTLSESILSSADQIDALSREATTSAEAQRLEELLAQADLMGRGLDRLVREARPLVERLEGSGGSRLAG
jgi:predicted  nucleic acid-binding Zn-ribbon protein